MQLQMKLCSCKRCLSLNNLNSSITMKHTQNCDVVASFNPCLKTYLKSLLQYIKELSTWSFSCSCVQFCTHSITWLLFHKLKAAWKKALSEFWWIARFSFQIAFNSLVRQMENLTLHQKSLWPYSAHAFTLFLSLNAWSIIWSLTQ